MEIKWWVSSSNHDKNDPLPYSRILLASLWEKVAKFIEKAHMERVLCHIMPLCNDKFNYETGESLPRLSVLFGRSNQSVRVFFSRQASIFFGNGY